MARKEQKAAAKPYHHGDLRRALIEGGLHVLAEQGAHGLNLREVARVAGVSHTAPYRHFADKDALVAAIAEDGFHQLIAVIEVARQCPSENAIERLVVAGEAYTRFALEHPEHFKVMFSGVRDPQTHPELYRLSKLSFSFLIELIQAGQRRGDIVDGDAELLAKSIWAAMHGLAVLMNEQRLPLPLSATPSTRLKQAQLQTRECLFILMQGVAKRAP